MSGAARVGSRLETDDEGYCKWCGKELPEMLVHGPIAGGDTEYAPAELCGTCEGKRWTAAAKEGGS